MSFTKRTTFIPNEGQRKDLAILLVGTAGEHNIDQRSIQMVSGGFWVTEELADKVYADVDADEIHEVATVEDMGFAPASPDAEPEPEPEPAADSGSKSKSKTAKKKTSGNRAAKKQSTTEKE